MKPKVNLSFSKLVSSIFISIKYKLFLFLLRISDFNPKTSKLIIDLYSVILRKKTSRTLQENKWKSNNILTTYEFISLIKKISNGNDTCHIICSGESVFETIDIIKPQSFSLGYNFSGLIYPYSQLYFMECAVTSPEVLARKTKILSQISKSRPEHYLFWKNIAGGIVSYKVIKDIFSEKNYYLLDYFLPEYQKIYKNINNICLDKVFNNNDIYIPNFCNSIVTFISLASKVFKKIILHGHDMGGKRFYESEKFCPPEYINKKDLNILINNVNHQTKVLYKADDKSTENVRFIMSDIRKILKAKNVELLNARDLL